MNHLILIKTLIFGWLQEPNLIEKWFFCIRKITIFHLKFVLKVVKNDGYSKWNYQQSIPRHLVPYLRQLIELIQTNQYENVFAESGYGLGEMMIFFDFKSLPVMT